MEGGGHALFMLDNVLKLGRDEPPAENADLVAVLTGWGVTANKDLVLDLCGIGNMFGAGPEIPIVLNYESHAITRPLARVPTAFPLPRSLDVKSGGKATVEKLFGTTEDSISVTEVTASGGIDPKKGQEGTVHARRRRHRAAALPPAASSSWVPRSGPTIAPWARAPSATAISS